MASTRSTNVISRLLVANRGEIARRVMRTCRTLGIETVAVHSDADAHLSFVDEADVAVRLPGSAPAETYLRVDLLLDAARASGADAVHPGYGFLSESAALARAVLDAGLVWVGPDPEAIEAMGSKVAAKRTMEAAGVPVLADLDPATVTEADLPVLVKAAEGGGGRGMRVVRRLADLDGHLSAARAEAAAAFGDGTVFVEPYVERGRHVEVQVVGDGRRTHVLGDRDCSVQRRHQKVVEEAPAPGLSPALREAMHDAARAAGEAIRYRSAGTVELLHDPDRDQFWFLEMNTRLQVEHPVTECVTGLDLVELQLAVAEGRGLDALADLDPTAPRGHAVEVRLYAEDPAADWQPQSGRLTRFEIPDVDAELTGLSTYGIRLDAGFRGGDEVGTSYDAMLAKVVAWGPDRETALRRLAGVLRRARLHGVRTNRDLLVSVLRHPAFVAADLGTDFLDRHDLTGAGSAAQPAPAEVQRALFAAAAAQARVSEARRSVMDGVPAGWRNVTSQPQTVTFRVDDQELAVGWFADRGGVRSADLEETVATSVALGATPGAPARVVVAQRGLEHRYDVHLHHDRVDVEGAAGHLAAAVVPRFVDPTEQAAEGSLLAPLPGAVVAVRAAVGDRLTAGAPVLVLEAMKMQHPITAPTDGIVTALPVRTGDQVGAGDVLAVVEPAPGPQPTQADPTRADQTRADQTRADQTRADQTDPHHDDVEAPA